MSDCEDNGCNIVETKVGVDTNKRTAVRDLSSELKHCSEAMSHEGDDTTALNNRAKHDTIVVNDRVSRGTRAINDCASHKTIAVSGRTSQDATTLNDNALHDTMAVNGRTAHDTMAVVKNCKSDYITAVNDDASHDMMRGVRSLLADMVEHIALCADAGRTSSKKRGCMWPHFIACCVPEAGCGTESLICTSKHRYTRLKRYEPPTSLEEAEFVMVADSMEDLRELEVKFREKQPTTVKKGRAKKVVQPPPRQQCVVELHKRLCNMLTELGPWEGKLAHAARRARAKLRKEYDVLQMKINHHEEEKSVWSSEEEELENEGCVSDSAVTENGNDEENAEEVEVKNPADPCGNNLAIKTEVEGEAKVDNDHTLKLDKFTMVADSTRKRHLRGKRGGKMSNDQLVTSTQGRVRKRKLLLDEADNDDSSKKKKQAHTSLGEEDAGTVKRKGVDRVTAKGVMNTNSKLTNAVCFPKAGDVIAQGDSTAVRTVPLMARNVQVQPSLVRTLIQRPNLAVKTTDARPVSPSGKTQEQKAIQVLVHGSGIAGSIPLSSLRTVDSGRSDVHVVGSVPLAMYQNIKTQSKPVAATLVSPATPQLPSRQVMQTMRPPLGKVYVPVYIGGKVVLAEVGSQLLHKSPPANINVNTASQQAVISNQPTLPVVSSVNTVVAGVSPILQDAAAKCNQADTSFPPLSATAVVSGASTRVIKKALTQVTLGSPVAAVTKVVSSNVNMPGSVIVQGANVASSRVILAGNATTIGANKVIGYESTHAASGISHGSKQSVATVVKTSPVINPKGSLHKICFGQVDSATSRGPRAATVAADKLYICNSRDVGIVRKTVPAHTASSAMVPGARAAPNVTSPIIQTLVGCVSSISDSSTVPSAPMPAPQAVMGCATADAKVGQGGMKTLESAGVQGGSIVNVLRTCAPTYANTLRDAAADVNPDCRQSPNIATSGCADAVNTSWKNKTTLGYAMQASSSTSHMSPSLNSAHSPAGQRTSVSRKTGDVLLEDRPCETTAAAAAPDVHVSSPTLKQICQKPIEAGHTQQTLAFTSQASADTNSTGQAKSNVVTVLQPSPDGKMYVVRVVPATSVHNAKTLVQGSALNTSGLISSAQLRTSVLPASQKIPYLSKSFQSKPMPTLSTRISPLKSEVEQSKVGKGLQLKEKRSAFHRDVRETQNPDKSDVENVNIVGLHKQNCIIGPGATKVYKLEQTIAVTDKRSISANIIDQSRGINRDGDDKKFKHESDIKMEIGELGRKVVNAHTQFAAELGEAGVNDGVNVKAEPVAGTLSRHHLEHSSVKSNSVHIASNGMQPVSAPSYHVNKQVPLAPKPVSTPIMSTSPLKIVPSMHVSSPSHVSVVRPTKASHAFGLPQFYSLPGGQVVTSQLGSIVSSSVAMPSSGSTASNIVPSTTTAVVMPRVASIGTVAQQPMTVQVRGQSAKSARQVIQGMRLPSGQLVTMKNSAPLPAVKDMQSTAVVQQPVSAGKSAVVAPGMNVSLRGPVRIILPPGTIVPRFGFASATVQRPLLVPRAATGGVGQIRNSSIVDGVITFGIPGQSVTSTRSVNVESSRTTTVRPAVSTAGQDGKPLVLNLSRDLVVSDGNVVRQTSLLQHTGAGEMRANATNTQELVVLQSQQGKLVKPVAQSTQSVLSQQSSILAASGSVVFTQK
ncbi:PREDICTED: uncharacterized protein KIAA2026-like [Priapulus caudatus]|uniref:Uncharacterized protein KIAA2026-like n=1 Tax=Priapulus caudatus TaxID=37621 RepID=A0ABM1ESF4_PRICU|nr:PREDICTED: uncharacterized protein KIAA2026-like [Priapulus caudatus]